MGQGAIVIRISRILMFAASLVLAAASAQANEIDVPNTRTAVTQPQARPPVPTAGPALPWIVTAQNVAPLKIPGTYSGKVERRYIKGEQQATRTYRLTMNSDMNTGKVLIYELDGKLLYEIGLVGKMINTSTFEGKTTVINATPTYKPDDIRLIFSSDRKSVQWYHNDGTLEGSGTLSR
jgi:hypothetical protein